MKDGKIINLKKEGRDKTMKTRIIYGLLAGLFFGLYWLTWRGAVLFVGILAVSLLAYLIIAGLHRRYNVYISIIGIIAVGMLATWLFISRIIPYAFSGPSATTIFELRSLDFLSTWLNFGLITFLIPVILALLVYQAVKRGEAPLILLLAWSMVILVATLVFRRYAYYFAVNVALLTGWLVWYVWQKLSVSNLPKAIAVTAVLCGLVLFPNIQMATTSRFYHTPSDAWYDTLTWVKNNTPEDSLVLAWWDYRHWIMRVAEREEYDTSDGIVPIAEVAHLLLSFKGEANSVRYIDYLIVDYAIITYKFWAIATWADLPIEPYSPEYYQTLLMRLYNGEPVGQYRLVYQSEQEIQGIPEIKVFYKRKIIDGQ